MHISIFLSLIGIISYITYLVIHSVSSSRYHASEALRRGCQPPKWFRHQWPFGIDFVWNIFQADRASRFPEFMTEIFDNAEGGAMTMKFQQGPSASFITIDPENIKAILATQFSEYGLGYLRAQNFEVALGSGIFTQDGKPWEHSRALLRPQFNRDQILDLDLAELNVQHLMKHFKVDPKTGWTQELDLQPLIVNLTLDGATEFLFGEAVNAQLGALAKSSSTEQHGSTSKTQTFGRDFDTMMLVLGWRSRLQDLYWLYDTKEFRRSIKAITQFADHYVSLALANKTSDNSKAENSKYTFLSALADETQDPVVLRSQLLNVLLAGRDTTAGLIGYVFHILSLSRNRHWYIWLRNAIIRDFGPYTQSSTNPSTISIKFLRSCPELQAILNETLRLYSPVPNNTRIPLHSSTTLPRGGGPDGTSPVYVHKGEPVDYSVYLMHRRKDLWGDDAEMFNPKRWETRSATRDENFMPFNAGPRICPGMQYAMVQAGMVVVRLVQRFGEMERCVEREIVEGGYKSAAPGIDEPVQSYVGSGNGVKTPTAKPKNAGGGEEIEEENKEEKENPKTGQGITWGRMRYTVTIMPEKLWVRFR